MDQEPIPSDKKEPRPFDSYLAFSGFAFQLLGGIAAGGVIGYYIDQYFQLSFPWFMLSLIVVMLTGMLYQAAKRNQ